MIVNDLVQPVKDKLAGRTGIDDKVAGWIKRAVNEITASYKFEELCLTGELKTFTANQGEYILSDLVGNDIGDITMIHVWFVYTDSSLTTGYPLDYRTPPVVDPVSKFAGSPAIWTRFGKKFIVGPKPNQAYPFYLRFQQRHPWANNNEKDPAFLENPIMIPDDWQDILEYAAAERGAHDERMLDYASSFHQTIFGDPEFELSGARGKGKPGLIFRRQLQQERDMSNNERQLQPIVNRI